MVMLRRKLQAPAPLPPEPAADAEELFFADLPRPIQQVIQLSFHSTTALTIGRDADTGNYIALGLLALVKENVLIRRNGPDGSACFTNATTEHHQNAYGEPCVMRSLTTRDGAINRWADSLEEVFMTITPQGQVI